MEDAGAVGRRRTATRVDDRRARGTEALSVLRYARERLSSFLNTPSNAILRRLLFDQGVRHWRGYLFAFAMMGLIAATTALSAWIIGRIVDQIFVGRNLAVSQILAHTMADLALAYPPPSVNLAEIRRKYHAAAREAKGGGKNA